MDKQKLLNGIIRNSVGIPNSRFIDVCESIVKYARLDYQEEQQLEIQDTIDTVKDILDMFNPKYREMFEGAIDEENYDYPVIIVYPSNASLEENESITWYNELSFYKRDSISDIYILLHEFVHLLTNLDLKQYEPIKYDMAFREIPSILSEFYTSDYLKNDDGNYLKHRFNTLRKDAISYLMKNKIFELYKNKSLTVDNLNSYLESIGLSDEDIELAYEDLLNNCSLNNYKEIKYIMGYLYGYKLYKENYSLDQLINEYRNNKINLPDIDLEEQLRLIDDSYEDIKEFQRRK